MIRPLSQRHFLPRLAEILETTPAALFERQRQLVRAGLLAKHGTSGPGAGVQFSGESLAVLLIGVLATDNLADIGVKCAEMADAKIYGTQRCQLTNKVKFKDALATVISDQEVYKRVQSVGVIRLIHGEITFASPGTKTFSTDTPVMKSVFFTERGYDLDLPPIEVSARLWGGFLHEIGALLHSAEIT